MPPEPDIQHLQGDTNVVADADTQNVPSFCISEYLSP